MYIQKSRHKGLKYLMSVEGRVQEIFTCPKGSFGMYQSPEDALYLYGRMIVSEDHSFG